MDVADELAEALIGTSAHTAPAALLSGLPGELARRRVPGAPHTVHEEIWHIAFWTEVSLDWIAGHPTPFPADAGAPFAADTGESVDALRERLMLGLGRAAALAGDALLLGREGVCPSRPGEAARRMTAGEQMISMAAHNSYHFGRIVLLRQLLGAWPPPGGGYTW